MKNYILQLTTGEKFKINDQEAMSIIMAKDDQSVAIKRIGVLVQKRMVLIYPEHGPDQLEECRKQQTGILHDGTKVRRHFGQWVDYNCVPDDEGHYSPIKLDRDYYPEVGLDVLATEDEWRIMKETKQDYYEFLGIVNRAKRIGSNNGLTHIMELDDDRAD